MENVLSNADRVRKNNQKKLGQVLQESLDAKPETEHENVAMLTTKNIRKEINIEFMFYSPLKDDYLINNFVAFASREVIFTENGLRQFTHFAHVELSFPVSQTLECFPQHYTMGFSITQTDTVYFKLKRWRSEYHKISLQISIHEYLALYTLCQKLSTERIKFDRYGMYSAGFAPIASIKNRKREIHGTFCSKIIVEILQEQKIATRVFSSLIPCICTPNLIYKTLTQEMDMH